MQSQDIFSILLEQKLEDVVLIFSLISIIIVSIYISFSKRLTYSVAGFALVGILLGMVSIALGSPLLGAIQVLIYSGTISILMLAIISLTRGDELEPEKKRSS